MTIDFPALEALMRQDPGGRGVSNYLHAGQWLAGGALQRAARGLAQRAGAAAIVSGFCIADYDPPTAETDGPPGALYLARSLAALGWEVVLVSDRYALPLLEVGRRHWGLDVELFEIPLEGDAGERWPDEPCPKETWIDALYESPIGRRLTHLIAIERAGPSHTLESLRAQARAGPPPLEQFDREVPVEHRNACHNMRGLVIDAQTAPAHRVFERARQAGRNVRTVAIGDGGNEIGMGAIPWEVLRAALSGDRAGRIICRIAADDLILAGVSNWGAYALACAAANLCGRGDLLAQWTAEGQRELIELLVREGGAIDGCSRRHTPTVDGLALESYLGVLEQIRNACR